MSEPTSRAEIRVLVLDAQYCHALAAVRSLGRRGLEVHAASYKGHADGLRSRYCARPLVCPSPNSERDAFWDWLKSALRRERYDATLFFDEATADILSVHRNEVQALTGCPMPPRETFLAASRKDRVMRAARRIGVPIPATLEITPATDLERLDLTFPVVVKGVQSSGGQQVGIARSVAELRATVDRIGNQRRDPGLPLPIVQEFIPGTGYGLSAVMHQGQAIACFMHRRLEEHDVSRGVGLAHGVAAARSVDEPALRQAGLALLRELDWEGIAMVEFRRDARNGEFKLLEVNPRFVGSLDLAIAAGADLAWSYVALAMGRPTSIEPYRVGLTLRWLLSKNIAHAVENPAAYVRGILASFLPDSRCDLWLRDPKPHWSQLRDAVWWLRKGRAAHVG